MKIFFIGDIFSKPGRVAVNEELLKLKKQLQFDFCIANVENTTHGRSISIRHYEYLKKAGIDFMTLGNHSWEHEEIFYLLDAKPDLIRPLNIKPGLAENKNGVGTKVIQVKDKKIRITNLLGLTCPCHNIQSNPFLVLKELIKNDDSDIHIVDFHTETTSEKKAMLLQFAGQISALIGTHTHVTTADEQIFKNTAFITDIGMTGPKNGIIGAKPETIIAMFNNEIEHFKLEPASGDYQFNGLLIEFDDQTNKPVKIQRYNVNNN